MIEVVQVGCVCAESLSGRCSPIVLKSSIHAHVVIQIQLKRVKNHINEMNILKYAFD